MSEGKEVREAFDGPKVEHDALIDFILARNAEEHERSSDASESSAKVAEFVEETGLNSQALSWGRTITKKLPKKDGQAKAMDVIRSLKLMLPMIEAHVAGQGTIEMDLEDSDEALDHTDEAFEEDAAQTYTDDADNVVTPIDFGEPVTA